MLIPIGIFASSGAAIPLAGYLLGFNTTQATKMPFVTETFATVTGYLAQTFQRTGSMGSNTGGYTIAGYYGSNTYTDAIYKARWDTDSQAYVGSMYGSYDSVGAMSNPQTAGYMAGGYNGFSQANVSTIAKWSFPTEAYGSIGNSYPQACHGIAGYSNSGVAGYLTGGGRPTGSNPYYIHYNSTVKFVFSNDAFSNSLSIGTARRWHAPFENKGVAGYVFGGYENGGTAADKRNFSNDSNAQVASYTDVNANPFQTSFSYSGTAGYAGGGWNSYTARKKWAFPSDTRFTLTTSSYNLAEVGGYANNGTDY
jgi:hypothetical protein